MYSYLDVFKEKIEFNPSSREVRLVTALGKNMIQTEKLSEASAEDSVFPVNK